MTYVVTNTWQIRQHPLVGTTHVVTDTSLLADITIQATSVVGLLNVTLANTAVTFRGRNTA